jgi:hypothetical protein
MTLRSTQLLTGLCAMTAPQDEASVSIRDFCSVLGINPKAKYVRAAFENRKEYNDYFALDGPIQINERVVCRGGDNGTLVAMESDSLTVILHPWDTKVTYKSLKDARMRRYEPQLDLYDRAPRSDKTSDHVIETIDAFKMFTML